jgi:putative tricarboxylic transport membrane protein
VNNSMFDVGAMLVFGLVGYIFKKVDIPLAPVVLTFVLGKLMENSLMQSLTIYKGNFFALFTRPISGTLLIVCIVIFVVSIVAGVKNKKGVLAEDFEM